MMRSEYFKFQEEIARRFGAKPTEAMVLALIKTAKQPQSLDDIARQTGYSLATISNIVRKYEEHNIVFRVKKPGSRKIYVDVKRNFLKSMRENMEHVAKNCEYMMQQLPEIIKKNKNKEERKRQEEELKQTKKAHKIMIETIKKLQEL